MRLLLATLILLVASCKKNEDETKPMSKVQLHLMDSPAKFDNLYLDIQEVFVNHSELGWVKIGPRINGIYDILSYKNGVDTLFCLQDIQSGSFSQIRLVLGSNNSIVVEGVTHSITIPSASQSGLKINCAQNLDPNQTAIRWVDFDVAKSVVQLGNGTYILKPVIRTFNNSENGKIRGSILPLDAEPLVVAIKNTDTITAIPNADGFFQFSGLNGTYSISFLPYNTNYNGFTLVDKTVINGQVLELGAFSF